jgi:hypothetical protein
MSQGSVQCRSDRQRTYKARSYNSCCSWTAVIITYFECMFVAFGIQHAMRVLRYHLWPARLYDIFSILCDKLPDFRGKASEYKTCFDFLYKFCLNISHSKKNSAGYDQKCISVCVQSRLLLSILSIKSPISNIMKILLVDAELFHSERQTGGHT